MLPDGLLGTWAVAFQSTASPKVTGETNSCFPLMHWVSSPDKFINLQNVTIAYAKCGISVTSALTASKVGEGLAGFACNRDGIKLWGPSFHWLKIRQDCVFELIFIRSESHLWSSLPSLNTYMYTYIPTHTHICVYIHPTWYFCMFIGLNWKILIYALNIYSLSLFIKAPWRMLSIKKMIY